MGSARRARALTVGAETRVGRRRGYSAEREFISFTSCFRLASVSDLSFSFSGFSTVDALDDCTADDDIPICADDVFICGAYTWSTTAGAWGFDIGRWCNGAGGAVLCWVG